MGQVVIDDGVVRSMMGNPHFRREFPFLATAQLQVQAGTKSCGKCGRKQRTNTSTMAGVRRAIGSMNLDKKAKLKEMLSASQVVVRYDNGSGKIIKMRF